jgi:hypothetical protein
MKDVIHHLLDSAQTSITLARAMLDQPERKDAASTSTTTSTTKRPTSRKSKRWTVEEDKLALAGKRVVGRSRGATRQRVQYIKQTAGVKLKLAKTK